VRGLKQGRKAGADLRGPSHPVRVRGLKHLMISDAYAELMVAPRAGAWIETSKMSMLYK